MTVSAQHAQEHLSELLAAADGGETVEIAREGNSYKLFLASPKPNEKLGKRILGAGVGELVVPTDEEWRAMKEEDARLMNDAPLMTSGEV